MVKSEIGFMEELCDEFKSFVVGQVDAGAHRYTADHLDFLRQCLDRFVEHVENEEV